VKAKRRSLSCFITTSALLRRRDGPHGRHRPARDWSRSTGRARYHFGSAHGRRVALLHIRMVSSDILESYNGSSSMATVCGTSLALFDAGIALKGAVAGVAHGPGQEGERTTPSSPTLTAAEDHYGDMDFKVAGTRAGITALQMDIKIGGLTHADSLTGRWNRRARRRLFLLGQDGTRLLDTGPRTERSAYAPRIETVMSDPHRQDSRSWIGTGWRPPIRSHHRADRRQDRVGRHGQQSTSLLAIARV